MANKIIIAAIAGGIALAWATTQSMAATRIAAGGGHTAAVRADGTLRTWGANPCGQLGDGTTSNRALPKSVGTGQAAVSAGGGHTVALRADGSVWTWGCNDNGQLGDGSATDAPSARSFGGGYTAIAGGGFHTLGLKSDGSLWGAGANTFGALGDNTTNDNRVPMQIGTGYSQIAAGMFHSVALKTDGSLWAWGWNLGGQIGDGTTTDRQLPKQIGSGYVAIAAGGVHTVALKADGSLWAWGSNSYGQIGDGGYGSGLSVPTPRQIGTGYTAVAAGGFHTLALKTDGTLWAWGYNVLGQLGDGTTTDRHRPTQIGSGFTAIAAGTGHSVALKADGSLWAWGNNTDGAVGNGGSNVRTTPVQVDTGYGPVTPQSGWWWNPAEGGRGFFIEQNAAGTIVFAPYLYAPGGRATWYLAVLQASGSAYAGNLDAFNGGQTLTGPYHAPGASAGAGGPITLRFTDAAHGTLTWGGQTTPIERFNFAGGTSPAFTPQSGWWWNASESGRGFSLEIQGSSLFLAGYMYDAAGNPIWYLSSGTLNGTQYRGNWAQYANGQTLGGSFAPATLINGAVGQIGIDFTSPTAATLTLPDGRMIGLSRFSF